MTLEGWVTLGAAALAAWGAWLSVPRSPVLDWERLFKLTLATLHRGEVEAIGGDAASWRERLEGFLTDPTAAETLMEDPADLGADWDPEPVLGAGATWDAIAAWDAPVREGLTRRLGHVVFACAGPSLAENIRAANLRAVDVPVGAPPAESLAAPLTALSDRLIILCDGARAGPLMRMLAQTPALRDRLLALVSIGGALPPEDAEWLKEAFTHEAFDTELLRTTPYASIVDVDPGRSGETDQAAQRFPIPPPPTHDFKTIASVCLGPLPLARVSTDLLTRALLVTLAYILR